MTNHLTIRVPRDWLGPADTIAVYLLKGAQTLDVLGFDVTDKGKLIPRFQPVELIPTTEGDPHDHPQS